MQKDSPKTAFIIQHMEEYLYDWCYFQYMKMKQYLQSTPYQLWITNTQPIIQFSKQQCQNNQKLSKQIQQNNNNWIALQKQFSQDSKKYRLISESVITLQNQQKLDKPVCMLDLRAQKQLSPTEQWGCLVFGGILGDHPPRDRPAPVRKHFPQIRHLGSLQLATDTAVLVSELILHKGLNLKQIPMIKQPTIKGQNKNGEKTTVQMEGFSYVSKQLDIEKGLLIKDLSKKEKKNIYMSQGVKNLLIQQDLNAQMIM